ncbi:replication factor C small subunit [Candidatus Nitrosocosmicus franklandus]|uniref:Replication factor C small subunit n=1 Tax=Candidatus Nitrosocosmicus franklandianus TaxID=1798806 RepID=A0A484IAD6_9ARCH|nr:replication factor C small subunit [Candidatus Nitrosocosmicus franklandus]VFJ13792.1 Replication factor C small subunit [Candidatus Nitrosocosmicus franklandus]
MEKQQKSKEISDIMWVEKYRPTRLDQIINQKEIVQGLENLLKKPNELPHLLFTGPAGIGKTTTALCLARQILGENWKRDTLELNASDERGIKMVRERVKEFASIMKLSLKQDIDEKPFKIIILDEADEMTSEAQTALRRIIEDSAKTTRFIFICNYLSQIIEPIQSRCVIFRFSKVSEDEIVKYLKNICANEGVKVEEKALHKIYEHTNGDLRYSINILQAAAASGNVNMQHVQNAIGISGKSKIAEIINLAVNAKFNESRIKLLELLNVYGVSETDFLKYANEEIYKLELKDPFEVSTMVAEYDYRLANGAHPEIQLAAFLAQLGRLNVKRQS